jgi:hypothetical protein
VNAPAPPPHGERRKKPRWELSDGRRKIDLDGIAKRLSLYVGAAVATVAAMGGLLTWALHVLGVDIVSVRRRELTDIRREVSGLYRNDTLQKRNQDSMLAIMRRTDSTQARSARYLCFVLRRYDPQAIEPGDPCVPLNGRRPQQRPQQQQR